MHRDKCFFNKKVQVSLFRNDVFEDKEGLPKQIEFNTMAVSMGTFADAIRKFHLHFTEKHPEIYGYKPEKLPLHDESVVSRMATAFSTGLRLAFGDGFRKLAVVMVVSKTERNVFDQLPLQNILEEEQFRGKIAKLL